MTTTIRARAVGSAVGLGLSAVLGALALGLDIASGFRNPIAPTVTAPLVVTGALVGLVMGPAFWRASARRAFVVASLKSAALAVLVGDGIVVLMLAGQATDRSYSLADVPQVVLGGMAIYLFGLVAAGLWAFVTTFVASVIAGRLVTGVRDRWNRTGATS